MLITKVSTLTGQEHTLDIPVTQEQIDAWHAGDEPIHDVLSFLSADDREFLITGITPDEWDALMESMSEGD